MKNEFLTLLEFLDRCGPEAAGREIASPNATEAARLRRFALGDCEKQERLEICTMLQNRPPLLRWLAGEVKLTRAADGRERSEATSV